MNSGDYNIEAENSCASLLSQFNSNFIFDICTRTLNTKDVPSIEESPNIVNAAEITFNDLMNQFPVDVENIKVVRDMTYMEVIDRLCTYYDAVFVDPGDEYHFLLARNLYFLLASGYSRCLIKFLSSRIYKNKNELYEIIGNQDIKRSKDTTTSYYKRICKNDPKLGYIISNIGEALDYIL